jgi:hypothetical protein
MAKITHFKKAWLKGVKLIGRTYGKVELVVASTVTERNRIVTLRAIPADKFAKIKELFANTEEVPVEQMKDVFLTASIWINDPENLPKLPMKGEIVVGNIDLVPTREDRSKYVLRVQHIALQPAEVAPVLDWDGFFDEVPNSEQVPAVMTTEDISH